MRLKSGIAPALIALALLCAAPLAGAQIHTLSPALLQAAGALIEPVSHSELLTVIRLDGSETTNWYLLGPAGHARLLGSGLSQLPHVQQIAVSPNKAWLAVLSSGSGQPIVEIVDLKQLLEAKRYVVLQQINPSPGTIRLHGWQEQRLILSSNAPLARRASDTPAVPPGQLLPAPRNFAVTINTGRIEEFTPAQRTPRGTPHALSR